MIVNIDGRDLVAGPEETVLQVARRNNIRIPVLCEHAGLEPWGGCRLCVVEMTRPGARSSRVVPSCLQPVEDGMRVETHSPRILHIRAVVLDLLLARAPEARRIQELALEHGVKRTSFVPRAEPDKCVLCCICIRACAVGGASAIATAGRGATGRVSLPFGDDASACIGCGACALSCPTGAIEMTDRGTERRIWGRTFERLRCPTCGAPTLTQEHATHLARRTGLPAEGFGTCDRCRREESSRRFLELVGKNAVPPARG